MIASHALVLAVVAGAAPAGGIQSFISAAGPVLPLVGVMVLFYFMILMPQQKRAKEHTAKIASVKRGDVVVLSSGVIGKVVRVEDTELGVEIAQNVTVKAVKSMVADIRSRDVASANDAKS